MTPEVREILERLAADREWYGGKGAWRNDSSEFFLNKLDEYIELIESRFKDNSEEEKLIVRRRTDKEKIEFWENQYYELYDQTINNNAEEKPNSPASTLSDMEPDVGTHLRALYEGLGAAEDRISMLSIEIEFLRRSLAREFPDKFPYPASRPK